MHSSQRGLKYVIEREASFISASIQKPQVTQACTLHFMAEFIPKNLSTLTKHRQFHAVSTCRMTIQNTKVCGTHGLEHLSYPIPSCEIHIFRYDILIDFPEQLVRIKWILPKYEWQALYSCGIDRWRLCFEFWIVPGKTCLIRSNERNFSYLL